MTVSHFDDLTYQRPDPAAARAATDDLLVAWDAARSSDERVSLVRRWDASRRGTDQSRDLAEVRFTQDVRDAAAAAEKEYVDSVAPDFAVEDKRFLSRVVAAPDRAALAKALGEHALVTWELSLSTVNDSIADDRRAESALVSRYDELKASIEVPFRGQTLNLSTIRGHFGAADRAVRRDAIAAWSGALGAHRDELDSIFAELTTLRDSIARKLGFGSFTELGYAQMRRTDYGPDEAAAFRAEIREHVVPLVAKIHARSAESLGVDDFGLHDEFVKDRRGAPKPKGDHDWMVDRATQMFGELGEDFAAFFAQMRDGGLLDLKARDGKVGGGYCEMFVADRLPFIFANFNGSEDDVRVFTHECGHAFQVWSSRELELRHMHWPTSEAAEIHSMGLELLTHPQMELFFEEDADRFRRGHLESGIAFLPYGAAIDEVQHRFYAEPDASPERRAEIWREIEATYLPWRRYDGCPFFEGGRFWQRQPHVYAVPFYYIDYCLAHACALQIWKRARADRPGTMALYRDLCELGGSFSFLDLLGKVGLQNPFEAGSLAGIVGDVAEEIGLA